jgi:hypothetical protein
MDLHTTWGVPLHPCKEQHAGEHAVRALLPGVSPDTRILPSHADEPSPLPPHPQCCVPRCPCAAQASTTVFIRHRFEELAGGQHPLRPVLLPDGIARTQVKEVFAFVAGQMVKDARDSIKTNFRTRRLAITKWALIDALKGHMPGAAEQVDPVMRAAHFYR